MPLETIITEQDAIAFQEIEAAMAIVLGRRFFRNPFMPDSAGAVEARQRGWIDDDAPIRAVKPEDSDISLIYRIREQGTQFEVSYHRAGGADYLVVNYRHSKSSTPEAVYGQNRNYSVVEDLKRNMITHIAPMHQVNTATPGAMGQGVLGLAYTTAGFLVINHNLHPEGFAEVLEHEELHLAAPHMDEYWVRTIIRWRREGHTVYH